METTYPLASASRIVWILNRFLCFPLVVSFHSFSHLMFNCFTLFLLFMAVCLLNHFTFQLCSHSSLVVFFSILWIAPACPLCSLFSVVVCTTTTTVHYGCFHLIHHAFILPVRVLSCEQKDTNYKLNWTVIAFLIGFFGSQFPFHFNSAATSFLKKSALHWKRQQTLE